MKKKNVFETEIFFLLNKKSGILRRNVRMIMGYKEGKKTNYIVLLGDSEKGDQWEGYSVYKLNNSSKLITIGNLLMDELLSQLDSFIIEPIENGFPVLNKEYFERLKEGAASLKKS